MQPAATGLRDRAVRDLTREGVLDRELAIVAQRSTRVARRRGPAPRGRRSPARRRRADGRRARSRRPARRRRRLERRLLRRREAVDARGEHCVHRVRHRERRVGLAEHPAPRRLDEDAAVDELADELLEEERIALRTFDDGSRRSSGSAAESISSSMRAAAAIGSGSSQSTVVLRFAGAPRRALVEQSGRAVASTTSGRARVREDALEEVEQVGLGPVDVLDEEHRRALEGESSTNRTAAACSRSRASSGWSSGATSSPSASPRISRPSRRRSSSSADAPSRRARCSRTISPSGQ